MSESVRIPTLHRREWLGATALAATSAWAGSALGAEDELPPPATPQEALRRLKDGNQRFVAGRSLSIHRDLNRVKAIAARQTPFAAFLGCADSRVPVEFIFDQGFGDLFVSRIAGNIASSENIGSLEFGTQILGAKVIYVLGHSSCGAVTATMQGREVPGQISSLFQYIRPAVKVAKGDVEVAVRENVRNQAQLLAEASPVISRLIQRGELLVAGGVYNLSTGLVESVDTGLTPSDR
ncbi:MAG TPA: carbonic anhydrase [Planctomycetaceae bacterium]|nr:carbonic anhydrase [Planctomycetaceae bacterium]